MKRGATMATVLLCVSWTTASKAVNPPGTPDDHFLCYKAVISKGTPKFTAVSPVGLVDGLEPQNFVIGNPGFLCEPADNEGEGITDANVYLESYKLKAVKGSPKHVKQTNIRVVNQVNPLGVVVDTTKVDSLLMPTAVSSASPPPAPNPASHNVDFYKCYGVKVSKGQPKFVTVQRTMEAASTSPKLFDIKKPKRLCAPASKDGSAVKTASGHLMCYQAKPAKGQIKHIPVTGLRMGNDFAQGESLDTKKDAEICVPSIVNPFCGDGVNNQVSEECDGSDDAACPGECTSLCACRQQFPFVLDSSASEVRVRGVNALGAGVDRDLTLSGLAGTIMINVDGLVGPGQYRVTVPVTALPPLSVTLPPPLGTVATACVFLEEDPDLPGSGLAGQGVLNCFGGPVAGIPSPHFNAYQDHCTNGTACNSGSPAGCSGALGAGGKLHALTGECVPAAPSDPSCSASDPLTGTTARFEDAGDPHTGVCQSPVYAVAGSPDWNPGDMVLVLNAAVDLRGPGDPCLGSPSMTPIRGPVTTGTAVSAIMDAFPDIAPTSGKVQAIRVQGTPFGCSPLLTTSGAALVTSAPVLDIALPSPFGLADLNTALILKAE